ncbi:MULTISPECIES: hypothetical protein [Acidaminococcus]|jgi:hypothetical protein|uniref:DUF1659 domain-containing protein n=1 Tax=Acidaminococcus TaxID=904 RepID=UPI0003AD7A78|nr:MULTISPECIES: hypothetical protein [Acidaminococcus]ERL20193.1 hypothetical protein HMPREF1246_0697 [Acidaminococcus sp. BV3L6]RJU39139.1 hypothetical protein DW817_00940 [Acidaminococcus sp. AM33-14BH]
MENIKEVTLQLENVNEVNGKMKTTRVTYKGMNPDAEDAKLLEAGKAIGSLMEDTPETIYAVKRVELKA